MKWRPSPPRNILCLVSMPLSISAPRIDVKVDEEIAHQQPSSPERKLNSSPFPLTRWELATLFLVFFVFSAALASIYWTMPELDPHIFTFPRNLADLRVLKDHVSSYTKDYTAQVLLGYIATYIFMQTFMIPGTIFLSLLAGALFGAWKGLFLVVFSATAGASSCYFLSKLVARPLVFWLWPDKIRYFRSKVAQQREKLLNYILFLRVTPTLPNTFINLASPIVDVPYNTFFFGTAFGLIPASLITVRAGLALGDLQSLDDLYNVKTMAFLFAIGILFIIPTILKRPKEADK
ncbi:hypothetical protein GOP47_0009211 [Adiantum capillus-veneris]|uniref:VTT domain-containing protein n=1 Tax=Adiantum capillus-veneris TaxID=13818 RepID=A0A9D4UVT1_ADICA|nr:hypothetical protein GOP47_0009211 [Adiantum capillus-veneris]